MNAFHVAPRKGLHRTTWIALFAASIAAAFLYARHMVSDPSVALLLSEAGARWIRLEEPLELHAQRAGTYNCMLRKRFTVAHVPGEARLVVRGFKAVLVHLDGKPLGEPRNEPKLWKEPRVFDLAQVLKPGTHEIILGALNWDGRPAVLAHCEAIGLFTDVTWEASRDGRSWTPAVLADTPLEAPIAREVPTVAAAFLDRLPFLLALFATVFASAALWRSKVADFARPLARFRLDASRLRWCLLAAWIVLGVNNVFKLPHAGFDVPSHLDYIRYVAERGRIPLANEGWEMFQAPLYYLVSAPFYHWFSGIESVPLEQSLRIVPLVCGALQVEIGFRAMRRVFPARADLQWIGTWISGLWPMNLYLSQAVGNEPMAGALTAAVLLACLVLAMEGPGPKPLARAAWIGACLGLALLTKASAVLLIPLVLGAWISSSRIHALSWRRSVGGIALTLSIAASIAGWWYLRNARAFGTPLITGTEQALINRVWWQDPSYRVPEDFLRFGTSLVRPVYSATHGIWDALYSTFALDADLSGLIILPPWNVEFMLAGAWLALPLVFAIVFGALLPRRGAGRRAQVFATLAVLVQVAALVHFSLICPAYSAVKATYIVGSAPCLALLACAGLDPLLRQPWLRSAVYAWLACFGVSAFAAYFVL